MKAIVIGGAGFIGSHLCDALLARGHRITCVDNFFIGTQENIHHLKGQPAFQFYEADASRIDVLDRIFEQEQPEYVFHLAANSDIQASSQVPEIEYRNTYSTTFAVLECMRRHKVKRLFFASTSAVYGDQMGAQVNEESLLNPISYYGGAKLGSEAIISAFAHMNDMHVLMFRFPNVIGPRLTHGVIFDFVRRLKENPARLTILGDGTQSKPYMYVFDLINAIMRFQDTPQGVTIYNIGVDTQTSVTRIAEIVCEKMGLSGIPFVYTGGRGGWKGDVPVFAYDLRKIHQTGWRASMTSDEAVAKTIEAVI